MQMFKRLVLTLSICCAVGSLAVAQEVPNRAGCQQLASEAGAGPMSEADIISFLAARGAPGDPFKNPRNETTKAELVEAIKQRGLTFRFSWAEYASFRKEVSQYITLSPEVSFPLKSNYGAPTSQQWLLNHWQLLKISSAVDFVRDDKAWRQTEFGVNHVGKLTLNADETYVWAVTGAQTLRGRWRKATPVEMKDRGGDQIVLLKAKGDWDWIVYQDRENPLPGDRIVVAEITTRQVKERGQRSKS